MPSSPNRLVELFGVRTIDARSPEGWSSLIREQTCPYTNRVCIKTRKSDSSIAIGTCTVMHQGQPLIICPRRLLHERKVFMDSLHLLTRHTPGNEVHVLPEVPVPGGSVDFFLASVRRGKVVDFVGIELQSLDTTGSIWPARAEFLRSVGVKVEAVIPKGFGLNWKMTAKTILMQLHHKIESFESWKKAFVLVIQTEFLDYVTREFRLTHVSEPAVPSDSMHVHAYSLVQPPNQGGLILELRRRLSTDAAGVAAALDRAPASPNAVDEMLAVLTKRVSSDTRITL